MTPAEILNAAADGIARTGLNKGGYAAPDYGPASIARVCAYGAMSRVVTGGEEAHYDCLSTGHAALVDQAAELLARRIDPARTLRIRKRAEPEYAWVVVTEFNDDPETKVPDVIRAMKEAASMADIGEENPKVVEFEPLPEAAPVPSPVPAEPVPA